VVSEKRGRREVGVKRVRGRVTKWWNSKREGEAKKKIL